MTFDESTGQAPITDVRLEFPLHQHDSAVHRNECGCYGFGIVPVDEFAGDANNAIAATNLGDLNSA